MHWVILSRGRLSPDVLHCLNEYLSDLQENCACEYEESIKDVSDPVMVERKKRAEKLAQEDVMKMTCLVTDWCNLAQLLHNDPILGTSR